MGRRIAGRPLPAAGRLLRDHDRRVTLSLSALVAAVVLFGVGVFVTRGVQKWLQSEYLPRTRMDAGLRNSITTGVGYIGVIAAGAFAVSYLGLSFDRITLVAGALSVGIGLACSRSSTTSSPASSSSRSGR